MELLFLGTSAGAPSASRNVQSCAVRLESGEYVVVDCGEGTQQQLLKASRAKSFRPSRTNLILVTHLHGDHSFGLPGLVVYLDNAATKKAPPLQIVGPVGVAAFLRTALILSRTELKRGYRVTELAASGGTGPYEEAALGVSVEGLHPDERVGETLAPDSDGMFALDVLPNGYALTAAPLAHGSIACVGYRFQEADAPGSIDARRAAAEAERAGDDARRICRALRECSLNNTERLTLADGSELSVADGFVGAVTRRGLGIGGGSLGIKSSPCMHTACDARRKASSSSHAEARSRTPPSPWSHLPTGLSSGITTSRISKPEQSGWRRRSRSARLPLSARQAARAAACGADEGTVAKPTVSTSEM